VQIPLLPEAETLMPILAVVNEDTLHSQVETSRQRSGGSLQEETKLEIKDE